MNSEIPIIKQRTEEWYSARLGKFTASNFCALMAKPAYGSDTFPRQALTYILGLTYQLFINKHSLRPDNDATRWGMRHEADALQEFGRVCGFEIHESGFIIHPRYPDVGATPDAIVIEKDQPDKLILVQVKCPFSQKNHLQYAKKINDARSLKKYRSAIHWQIQGEIWVTGASHSYFVSFDPRLKGDQRLHFALIERDQKAIDQMESIIPQAIALRNRFLEDYRNGISPSPTRI
jgi:hypothetical protein